MANYKSNYTGEQIDSALGVLQGKGLDEVVGLVKRNSDGTFSAESLSDKADKSTTVTNVAYDSTNHKLTKTINNTTSDVVTIATLKTELGSMPASDVYEWAKAANKPTYTASEVSAVATSAVGSANGVAPLNASSKIDSTYLPSYVDDVVEYAGVSNFPTTGESGIIYIDTTENKTYRWGGSSYVLIGGGSGGASPYSGTISAVTSGSAANGVADTFARGDHVHNLTKATIDALLVTTSSTEKFYREDGTWAVPPSSGGGGGSGTITGVTAGTGLSGGGSSGSVTVNHSNSITAQTTQAIYPIAIDAQGHITSYGTAVIVPDISGKIDTAGTGLSKSGTTLNHSNSITAQTTSAVYPIKIDAQGHISEYGSAVTIPTIPSNNVTGSGTSGYLAKFNGANTVTDGPQLGSSTTTFLRNDGTWATPAGSAATAISVTLTTNGWSNYAQTVTANGVTSSNNVIVTPAPTSTSDYVDGGVLCIAQGTNSLTFQCSETPSSAIVVNILIFT